jgi:hypothetical protein
MAASALLKNGWAGAWFAATNHLAPPSVGPCGIHIPSGFAIGERPLLTQIRWTGRLCETVNK